MTTSERFCESEPRVRASLSALFPDDETTARVAVDAVYRTGRDPAEVLAGDLKDMVERWDLLSRKEQGAAHLAQFAAVVASIFA